MFDDPATGHFEVGDSHHTTFDLNPTHVDPHGVCGHGSITTHPFGGPGISISGSVDGCIASNGHEGAIFTGPGGHGNPNTSIGVGFNW